MSIYQVEDLKSWIIYEDKDLLVLHKPAGIAVQNASFGQMDLESLLKNYFSMNLQDKELPYLGLVHRLDQPVEGLLVFAKNPKTAAELSRQLQNGKLKKKYLVLVEGKTEKRQGTLIDYIVKDKKTHRARLVTQSCRDAKRAQLHYQVLQELEENTLLEIEISTGRFHQIRVQLAGAGFPVAGDRKYNPESKRKGLALWAYSLRFVHPVKQKEMNYELDPDSLIEGYIGGID